MAGQIVNKADQHRKPKIAIGFFGITRSLKWTLTSIKKNIVQPAQQLGDVRIFAHLYYQTHIVNPRSGENDSLDPEEYRLLDCDEVNLEQPGRCLNEARYNWILSHGDAFHDEGKSLANLIHQLHSLQQVGRMIDKWEPDVVIMARPDLMYHDSLYNEIKKQLNRHKSCISIPNWQWFGGVNDRFAIGSRESCRAYTNRLDFIQAYIKKTGGPLPAERFLRYCLNEHGIMPRPMRTRASRIRANGTAVEENFLPISNGKYLKRSAESRLNFIVKKFKKALKISTS